jgi:hypothetical protein
MALGLPLSRFWLSARMTGDRKFFGWRRTPLVTRRSSRQDGSRELFGESRMQMAKSGHRARILRAKLA